MKHAVVTVHFDTAALTGHAVLDYSLTLLEDVYVRQGFTDAALRRAIADDINNYLAPPDGYVISATPALAFMSLEDRQVLRVTTEFLLQRTSVQLVRDYEETAGVITAEEIAALEKEYQ